MAKLNIKELAQRIKVAKAERNDKIREMRAKGYTLRQVGDKYGVTYEMLRKLTTPVSVKYNDADGHSV